MILILVLVSPLAAATTQAQTPFTVSFFDKPLAVLHFSVLDSQKNSSQYDRLAEHLEVLDANNEYEEKLIIFRLGIENVSDY